MHEIVTNCDEGEIEESSVEEIVYNFSFLGKKREKEKEKEKEEGGCGVEGENTRYR